MMDELRILVPPELSAEMEKIADKHGILVVELLRQFIKLGMLAATIEEDPHADLVIKQDNGVEHTVSLT